MESQRGRDRGKEGARVRSRDIRDRVCTSVICEADELGECHDNIAE